MEDLTAGLGKKHRAKKSGVKADKKVANKKKKLGTSNSLFPSFSDAICVTLTSTVTHTTLLLPRSEYR